MLFASHTYLLYYLFHRIDDTASVRTDTTDLSDTVDTFSAETSTELSDKANKNSANSKQTHQTYNKSFKSFHIKDKTKDAFSHTMHSIGSLFHINTTHHTHNSHNHSHTNVNRSQHNISPKNSEFSLHSSQSEELMSLKINHSRPIFDINKLTKLDIFVLDNSLRETTVGQLKGHVLTDKIKIFNALQNLGYTDFIVATFTEIKTVDDEIASHISNTEKMNKCHFYCFSELYDHIKDGLPDTKIPVGMSKMIRYGIKHMILEVTLCDDTIDYSNKAVYSAKGLVNECLLSRIHYFRENNTATDGRILLNMRDILDGWFITRDGHTFPYRARILSLFKHLSRLPKEDRLFGELCCVYFKNLSVNINKFGMCSNECA